MPLGQFFLLLLLTYFRMKQHGAKHAFPPQMKVKWKQMLLQVLRKSKNSKTESLTLHHSRKQSKKRRRDSVLYLKLSGYISLSVWQLQLRTFCQAQNCLKFLLISKRMFRQAIPTLSRWCCSPS